VQTNSYGNYISRGEVRKCRLSDCTIRVTAASHGLTNGDGVYLTGVNGMNEVNNRPFIVSHVTSGTYSIGVNGAEWGTHTSGGSSWCGQDGCQWRVFYNSSGELRAIETSTCVSERTGRQAYTDAAPDAAAPVGRNYPSTLGNPCPSATILPLSSDRAALKSLIRGLSVTGSTAGQIGMAWGWYAVSPNFNGLWPGSPAGAYEPEDTLKAVIIMTDGANVMSDTSSPNDSSYNGLGYIWQNRLGITSGNDSTRRSRMDDRMDDRLHYRVDDRVDHWVNNRVDEPGE
jgi:hypothetical protein